MRGWLFRIPSPGDGFVQQVFPKDVRQHGLLAVYGAVQSDFDDGLIADQDVGSLVVAEHEIFHLDSRVFSELLADRFLNF